MTHPQLPIVTLTLTPEEARMISTALAMRALSWEGVVVDVPSRNPMAKNYRELIRKIARQSGLEDTHL